MTASANDNERQNWDEFHGCFTGDCPHDNVNDCIVALREAATEAGKERNSESPSVTSTKSAAEKAFLDTLVYGKGEILMINPCEVKKLHDRIQELENKNVELRFCLDKINERVHPGEIDSADALVLIVEENVKLKNQLGRLERSLEDISMHCDPQSTFPSKPAEMAAKALRELKTNETLDLLAEYYSKERVVKIQPKEISVKSGYGICGPGQAPVKVVEFAELIMVEKSEYDKLAQKNAELLEKLKEANSMVDMYPVE
jgi:hypothetical protein